MKLLCIGNSFSEDATAYLHQIAEQAGVDLKVVNLYIGGCSFETHAKNFEANEKAYRYELNGVYTAEPVSINDTLAAEDWDFVTVQQVSQLTGMKESYQPYADIILKGIAELAPGAKVYFHQTWAYETDSDHPEYRLYDKSQKKMYESIVKATRDFCAEKKIGLIPCGETVQALRSLSEFDYENGGESLCRDGFHMSLTYGRYLTGAVFFETLTGRSIFDSDFFPKEKDIVNGYMAQLREYKVEERKIQLIREMVHKICER